MQTTTSERVYNEIRRMISTGELKPGDRLIQQKLADQLGTSHIPVIETIRKLERDGLVEYHSRWGAQVREWTLDDIDTVYRMREALEIQAVQLFTERATQADIVVLNELSIRFKEFVQAEDDEGCIQSDIDLHLHIAKCTQAPLLLHIAENSGIISSSIMNILYSNSTGKALHGPVDVHDELVTALSNRDKKAAETACKEHIRAFLELLHDLY